MQRRVNYGDKDRGSSEARVVFNGLIIRIYMHHKNI